MNLQVMCPHCNGECGYTEAILDDGSGCTYCGKLSEFYNDNGVVSIRKRLVWLWDCQIMGWFRWHHWERLFCFFGHHHGWNVSSSVYPIHWISSCMYCGKLIGASNEKTKS